MAQSDTVYKDTAEYLRRYADGERSLEEIIMEQNAGLVNGIAYRFRGRGVDFEDLRQIGSIGLLKAIRSFDCERGFAFSTYAVPLIIGEIRRFLRDDGAVKVSRGQKRLGAALMHEREKIISETGEEPRLSVLAERLGVTPEEAASAIDASSPVRSLSERLGDDDFLLEDVIPSGDDALSGMIESVALTEVIGTLPPLWRQIVTLRFYKDYSQQQTADALGLTQVKISREEKKIFAEMRRLLKE